MVGAMTRIRKIVKSERGIYEPAMSEEQILRVIVIEAWLRFKIKLVRINCPVGGKVRPNERGIPDLIGHMPGPRFSDAIRLPLPVYIEVKVPGGRRRPEQVEFIANAKADGCVAFFAESWTDVERELAHV